MLILGPVPADEGSSQTRDLAGSETAPAGLERSAAA
jgi:hypothetical protein